MEDDKCFARRVGGSPITCTREQPLSQQANGRAGSLEANARNKKLRKSCSHQCSRNSEDRVEALQYGGDEQELADACIHGQVGQVVPERGENRRTLGDDNGLRRERVDGEIWDGVTQAEDHKQGIKRGFDRCGGK